MSRRLKGTKAFEEYWNECGESINSATCPIVDSELDERIDRAMASGNAHTAVLHKGMRRRWMIPAAAACLLAILLPLGLHAAQDNGIRTVEVDGQRVVFACNTGCSVESMIQSFNELNSI